MEGEGNRRLRKQISTLDNENVCTALRWLLHDLIRATMKVALRGKSMMCTKRMRCKGQARNTHQVH